MSSEQSKDLNSTVLGIKEIQEIIPHRYPFLLVDRVTDIQDNFIQGKKNITINEPFFQGHFPEEPIMPGVLQIEAMAQLAAIYKLRTLSQTQSSVYFLTIDKAKFRKKVVPGDILTLEVRVVRETGTKMIFSGKAMVNGAVSSEAEMMAMIQKHPQ